MNCKTNYAINVKENTPSPISPVSVPLYESEHNSLYNMLYLSMRVDIQKILGTIILTINNSTLRGGNYAKTITTRLQASSVKRARNSKYPSGEGNRFTFQRKGVLRLTRPDSGKVRDASSRSYGRGVRFGGRNCIWFVSSHFLSCHELFRTERACRITAKASRPKTSAQAVRRGNDIYRPHLVERSIASFSSTGRVGKRAFWNIGSSSQYRKSLGRQRKKTPEITIEGYSFLSSSEIVEHYEELRSMAEQKKLHKLGLALFVHRGMATWMKTWINCTVVREKMDIGSSKTDQKIPANLRSNIVIVLASMVLGHKRETEL